jgi:hypothetical protein
MPTQDPLRLHNIPGDTISASPPGDHRNAPPSTTPPTPTTSFATEFPTPHEIFSTQSQQPHHHSPTVPNTNHHSITLAQSLKASIQQPKLPKNRTHHNKPSFHNPSELTEYLSNNKKFTDDDRYNVSFKLNLPDDSSETFKSFTKMLISTFQQDNLIADIASDIEFISTKLTASSRYIHLHQHTNQMSDDIVSKIEANLIQLNRDSEEYTIHVQPKQTITNGTILLLNIPSSVHNRHIQELATEIYRPYGDVIKVIPPEGQFFDEDEPKQVHVLVDLKSPTVPPKKQKIWFQDQQIKVQTLINSKLFYCAYCRLQGHHITQCPLRNTCPSCHADHQLYRCPSASSYAIKKGMAMIPQSYVDQVMASTPPENLLPQWIMTYEEALPERSKGYSMEVQERYEFFHQELNEPPYPHDYTPNNDMEPSYTPMTQNQPFNGLQDHSINPEDTPQDNNGFQAPRSTFDPTSDQPQPQQTPQTNPFESLTKDTSDDYDPYQSLPDEDMDLEDN